MSRLPGVVFDCDGTLADTEPLADAAWRDALAQHGYHATDEDFRAVMGSTYAGTFAYFAARAPLGDDPDDFRPQVQTRFRRLLDRQLVLYDDAVTTLRALVAAGTPVGVASSSSSDHVARILRLGGIADLPSVVVGAEDVTDHKPHPEPYLVAAAALGVDPGECAAVEDTPVGIEAARGAGLFTVAVQRGPFDRSQLGRAHRVVEQLTPASLRPPDPQPRRAR